MQLNWRISRIASRRLGHRATSQSHAQRSDLSANLNVYFFQNARFRVSQETDKKKPKNMYFRALVKSDIK